MKSSPFSWLVALCCLNFLSVSAAAFNQDRLDELDAAIEEAIATSRIPGAVLWLESRGQVYHKAYGYRALEPVREPMTLDTIFDLASLTKVMATTPAVLRLVESGDLDLDQPVQSILPEFAGHGKEAITVRHLMTHVSGLPPGIPKAERPTDYPGCMQWIFECEPKALPGDAIIYSDLNYVLLAEMVRELKGETLDEITAREFWTPLRMWDTCHHPPASLSSRIAPTEKVDGHYLRGMVHDPTCRIMGGAAGNAGLFSSAQDVARFCRMLLHQGSLDGVRIIWPETVAEMSRPQTPSTLAGKRGLGWDIDTGHSEKPRGEHFTPLSSYGHTGWTGTSIWIDPVKDTFLVLLTNRNHFPAGNVSQLRFDVATLAMEAAAAVLPAAKPKALVMNGVDVLVADKFKPLQGLKVGLITNHTGLSRDGQSTIDLLHQAPEVELKALFGPEHGIRGKLDQAEISDGVDDQTGVPVYSLYGESRKPQPHHLQGLDALLFDIQDIGCRFYTYISTMELAMEAAAEQDLPFMVLDRVNPIGGKIVDGPVQISEDRFTSCHPIAIQHGMTVGELARMFRDEKGLDVELTVIPVANWNRAQRFDETGLTWVNPSPNMRNLEEAILYPGIGLLEFTDLSVGRGTDTPFEWIGAPYIDAPALAGKLQALQLPGIRFEPVEFTPSASVFEGQLCHGLRFTISDRSNIRPIDTGLAIARALHQAHPNYDIEDFGRLLVHPKTLEAVKAGRTNAQIRELWETELSDFHQRRSKYLLYD